MIKKIWHKIKGVLLTIGLLALTIAAQVHHKNSVVNQFIITIDVQKGDNFLNPSYIKEQVYLKMDTLMGKQLKTISLAEVEEIISSLDAVAKVAVYFNSKGELKADIVPKKVVFRLINREGISVYLDDQGAIMPWMNLYTPKVPVINGYLSTYDDPTKANAEEVVPEKLQKDLYRLYQLITKDEFLNAQIAQLYVCEKGDVWMLPSIGKHKINLGKLEQLEHKINKLHVFYTKIIPVKGWETYTEVNLKFNQQIVCK